MILHKNEEKIDLTLDEWTSSVKSINNKQLFNIAPLPDGKFCNLGLSVIKDSCPAEVAIDIVKKKLEEFYLFVSKTVISSTTDGAAVMKKFGKLTGKLKLT